MGTIQTCRLQFALYMEEVHAEVNHRQACRKAFLDAD